MSSGRKGEMVVKKRSSQKVKRQIGAKPPLPSAKDQEWQESDAPNSNGKLREENGLKDLVLMGDEVGDPDISMLVQQENEILDDEPIDLKNPEVAAEVSEDPVRMYLRDIGEVKLLNSDSEFRLATIIEA